MRVNSPDIRNADGSTYNSEEDPRLTRIGKIIRKTSLDETPQILNIIKGDMSVIGPRPDLPEDIKLYNEYQRKKMKIRPGITGYSQAYFRNSASQKEKFDNDSYYAENLTLLLDIKILLKTIYTVVKKENVYKNKEV
jgi:lipopolysaccharide/colanic/teichoic acid biosynthesis glycosyltransferase